MALVVPAAAEKLEPIPLGQQALPTSAPPPGDPAPTPTPTVAPAATTTTATPETVPAAPPAPAAAAPAPAAGKPIKEWTLNFQNTEMQAVMKAMSQITGRNFLIDPRVRGQITFISTKPVTASAAYQIFISALKAQGFAVIEGPGNLVKVVPSADARQFAPVNESDKPPGGGEQIVTHVVVVQHGSAQQMIPLLRPLMAPTSQLATFDAANALVITDYADNIRRMLRIIEKVDQPASSDVNVITLEHASALDVADLLSRLAVPGFGGGMQQPGVPMPGGSDRFTVVPDMRTNSLLVRADNPGRVSQLRSLVEKLDVPALVGGNTRVIYLRNAEAVKLAEVLRGLLAGEARAQAAPSPGSPQPPTTMRGTLRTAENSLIQADEATNSLIISSTDAVYNNLRAVIEKLDVRRAQVYVEALIVEMSTTNASQLGFQWAGADGAGSGAIVGIQNFPSAGPGIVNAIANPASLANAGGLNLGYVGKQITLPDGTIITSIGALARALDEGNLANVLSTPNLMTLDNSEAKIVVGQNVPFVTGSFSQAGGGTSSGSTLVNPFNTIERKDVGLTLKIKPQISEGGTIKLEISQEVSSISPTTVSGASDLITNKRSIDTTVVIDDGDTIVLGGLIEDTTEKVDQSVPVLGKIPVLGSLFSYRSDTKRKTNLMVFLRPTVIRNADESYRLTVDRYDYLRGQNKEREGHRTLDRLTPKRPASQDPSPELLGPPSETGEM